MKWFKLVAVVAVVALMAACFPKAAFLAAFKANHTMKGALATGKCSICHVGKSTKLNPYGMAVKKALGKAKVPTAATFKAVDKGTFAKNIKAGKLPAG